MCGADVLRVLKFDMKFINRSEIGGSPFRLVGDAVYRPCRLLFVRYRWPLAGSVEGSVSPWP